MKITFNPTAIAFAFSAPSFAEQLQQRQDLKAAPPRARTARIRTWM